MKESNESTAAVEPRRAAPEAVLRPPADVTETEDGFELVAELPGVDEASVEVTLEGGVLTLVGRAREEERPGYRLHRREYRLGTFRRSFAVGEEVDAEGVTASLKDGLLRLRLPKARPQARRIAVRTA